MRADFLRFYHVWDWPSLNALTATSLFMAFLRQPESWTHRALQPDWQWENIQLHALARICDASELAVWIRTKDAQSGRNRPTEFPRPTLSKAVPDDEQPMAMSIEELSELLGIETTV